MEQKFFYQQGDVIIERISSIPSSAEVKKPNHSRGIVLADGEISGHLHLIEDVDTVTMFEDGNQKYLKIDEPTSISHDEHKTIGLAEGEYVIRIVQEYDHFAEEAREVRD